MTIGELRASARYWQERLGLNDWKITIRQAKNSEMAGDEYAGHAYWIPEYPEGTILVRRGSGVDIVLHELLHIRLEGHRPSPKRYDALYERALNALTDALLAAKNHS